MSSKLDPLDLFDVRSELTEDEIMVKETVGRFVDDNVIPLMREAFENPRFSASTHQRDRGTRTSRQFD